MSREDDLDVGDVVAAVIALLLAAALLALIWRI